MTDPTAHFRGAAGSLPGTVDHTPGEGQRCRLLALPGLPTTSAFAQLPGNKRTSVGWPLNEYAPAQELFEAVLYVIKKMIKATSSARLPNATSKEPIQFQSGASLLSLCRNTLLEGERLRTMRPTMAINSPSAATESNIKSNHPLVQSQQRRSTSPIASPQGKSCPCFFWSSTT